MTINFIKSQQRKKFGWRLSALMSVLAVLPLLVVSPLAYAAPVAIQQGPQVSGIYTFENTSDNKYISGDTKGKQLKMVSPSGSYTYYTLRSEGNYYYEISAGGYCMWSDGGNNDEVTMATCIGTDHNEWFSIIPQPNGAPTWVVQYSSQLYLGAVDSGVYTLKSNTYQEWAVVNEG
jgi:hypothetical protein